MDVYDELGVRKVINGHATLTSLGGSLMPPEVLAAMAEAAQHFVDIDDLQAKVGQRIAEWTHNESAYVSSGAAAGLVSRLHTDSPGYAESRRRRQANHQRPNRRQPARAVEIQVGMGEVLGSLRQPLDASGGQHVPRHRALEGSGRAKR